MNRVLVISPHPDDESIGCGGTLRRHVTHGDRVEAVFLTSGEKGGHGRAPKETIRLREGEARTAARILGLSQVEFWREPDGAVRVTRPLLQRLRAKLQQLKPGVIYVTHDLEMHPDHRAAARLVQGALNHATAPRPEVLMYEVWTPMPAMDHIEDISKFMAKKLQAVRAYRTQCAVVDFVAAVRGLNRYRGEMHSWPGGNYAEVFTRLRA